MQDEELEKKKQALRNISGTMTGANLKQRMTGAMDESEDKDQAGRLFIPGQGWKKLPKSS